MKKLILTLAALVVALGASHAQVRYMPRDGAGLSSPEKTAFQTAIGLPIGTSGATVPLLSTANTWSGMQTINAPLFVTANASPNVSLSVDSDGITIASYNGISLGGASGTSSFNAAGELTVPKINGLTSTELGFLDGVTSSVQTQLNAKAPIASPTFTGPVTISSDGLVTDHIDSLTGDSMYLLTDFGGGLYLTANNGGSLYFTISGSGSGEIYLSGPTDIVGDLEVSGSVDIPGVLTTGSIVTGFIGPVAGDAFTITTSLGGAIYLNGPISAGSDLSVSGTITGNGSGLTNLPAQLYSGSFSGVGTATTAFVVTIGTTMANNTYKATVTPTAALSAALFYISAKTTTTFTVTYLAGLTGTVQFDYIVVP